MQQKCALNCFRKQFESTTHDCSVRATARKRKRLHRSWPSHWSGTSLFRSESDYLQQTFSAGRQTLCPSSGRRSEAKHQTPLCRQFPASCGRIDCEAQASSPPPRAGKTPWRIDDDDRDAILVLESCLDCGVEWCGAGYNTALMQRVLPWERWHRGSCGSPPAAGRHSRACIGVYRRAKHRE